MSNFSLPLPLETPLLLPTSQNLSQKAKLSCWCRTKVSASIETKKVRKGCGGRENMQLSDTYLASSASCTVGPEKTLQLTGISTFLLLQTRNLGHYMPLILNYNIMAHSYELSGWILFCVLALVFPACSMIYLHYF